MLELQNVSTRYGHIQALENVSLTVEKGSIVCIIGSNGAGKSTLLKTIMGLAGPHSGQIVYNGHDITRWPTHQVVRHGISLVPEGRQLFGPLTVLDNLKLGTYKDKAKERRDNFDVSLERVYALFPVLGERARDKAGNFSGGQQQMLAIGRALMSRPDLLLLDEPSVGLSPLFVRDILDTLVKLRQQGLTIVLVEQNAQLALKLSDYAYVLETGSVCSHGRSANLLDDEDLKAAYLGRKKVCTLA